MHKDIQRGLYGLAMATGIFILGTSEASAAETTGSDSIAGGTQATLVITAPITVEDNAITGIGDPTTGSRDTGSTTGGNTNGATGTAPVTSGEDSTAGGTQLTPVITAPIGVEDNAITLIGDPTTGSQDIGSTSGVTGAAPVTSGTDSTAGGTQLTPVITTPIAVEGNTITGIGDPASSSGDTGSTGATAGAEGGNSAPAPVTTGEDSIAGGTQLTPVITTPIAVEDNAITLIGDPTTSSQDTGNITGGNTNRATGPAPITSGEGSTAGGTQLTPVITTPITVGGNAIAIIGNPTSGSTDGGTPAPVLENNGDDTTSGAGGPTTGGPGNTDDIGTVASHEGTDNTDGTNTIPVTESNSVGAGAEGTTGVGTPEGASAGGSVTVDGTVDTHATDRLVSGAVVTGVSVAHHGSSEHRAGVAASTVLAAVNTGFGIYAARMSQNSAVADHDGMLAATVTTAVMVAGMVTALGVTGAVLLLAGRRRAVLR